MRKILLVTAAALALSACQHPGMSNYGYQDVGQATTVSFGTIISFRNVDITGKNTGIGAGAGAAGGLIAGAQFGQGDGALAAALAGALIAGVAGHMAEQELQNRQGVEYVITLENGNTVTIVQNAEPELDKIRKGDRVMVQNFGTYQRVLPAGDLPEKIKKPKRIKVEE